MKKENYGKSISTLMGEKPEELRELDQKAWDARLACIIAHNEYNAKVDQKFFKSLVGRCFSHMIDHGDYSTYYFYKILSAVEGTRRNNEKTVVTNYKIEILDEENEGFKMQHRCVDIYDTMEDTLIPNKEYEDMKKKYFKIFA